jgi:hypothetical protein
MTHPMRPGGVAWADDQVLGSAGEDGATPWRQVVAPSGAQTPIMGFCPGALVRRQVVERAGSTGPLIALARVRGHNHGQNRPTSPWKPWSIDVTIAFRSELHLQTFLATVTLLACVASTACDDSPSGPSNGPTLRIVFFGSTTRRTDLPPSAQSCVAAVGATHIHPSWRNFATIPLQPVPPDRYEITFDDVPVGTRVSFRVNDQNLCDENPTGAVTRNVFANDVRLIQNATTPGAGDEPGYSLVVAADGEISQ